MKLTFVLGLVFMIMIGLISTADGRVPIKPIVKAGQKLCGKKGKNCADFLGKVGKFILNISKRNDLITVPYSGKGNRGGEHTGTTRGLDWESDDCVSTPITGSDDKVEVVCTGGMSVGRLSSPTDGTCRKLCQGFAQKFGNGKYECVGGYEYKRKGPICQWKILLSE